MNEGKIGFIKKSSFQHFTVHVHLHVYHALDTNGQTALRNVKCPFGLGFINDKVPIQRIINIKIFEVARKIVLSADVAF